jgi:hypothetical protein
LRRSRPRLASTAYASAHVTLKTTQRAAQPLQFLGEIAVLSELLFEVGDTRLDLLNDRADVRNLRHGSPSVDAEQKTLR